MSTEEPDTAANVGENGATVVLEKAPSKKGTSKKKGAPKGQKTAKGGKTKTGKKAAKTAAGKATQPRAESKTAKVLALLRRPKGATPAELARVTGWQNHSVRGFLSGAVGKEMGFKVESAKHADGARVYSIKK